MSERRSSVSTYADLASLLDELLPEGVNWESFYTDRERPIPFFAAKPDENLLEWFHRDMVTPGRVLELGCGHGRNAIYMATQRCAVVAVDVSSTAIEWAREQAGAAGVDIDFRCASAFELDLEDERFDFIYDCGLLHHLAPHRRPAYLELVKTHLQDEGRFGLVCFNERGGPAIDDAEIYRHWKMPPGIGFSETRLREILIPHFDIVLMREMQEQPESSDTFGMDFCWIVLMQRHAT
jgi:SAM-dependent methyltransferase